MAIITISRGTFSSGQSIAEHVAKKLGYRCVNREALLEIARLYNVFEELFKAFEATPDASVNVELNIARKRYLASLRAALMNLAKNDYLVYNGYIGHFLLQGIPNIIRVRINTSVEFRTNELIEREQISKEEAVKYIAGEDEERNRWTRFLYHTKWDDPALYDIVINLDYMPIHVACDILCHAANLEAYKSNAESRKKMEDLALSSQLKAIVANTKDISGGEDLKIEADAGVVTIRGTVKSLADIERVKMIVAKMPGIEDINSQMEVLPLAMIKIE